MHRLGSLISGGGTTMQEIVRAAQSGVIPNMGVGCVIASKDGIGGIEKARKLGVPVVVVDQRDFRLADGAKIDRKRFAERLLAVLGDHGVTVVTQNGWLPLMPEAVIDAYAGCIFNQHPGPPEEFGGKGMMGRAVHAAILEFQRLARRTFDSSVVAHHVTPKFDEGRVVQRAKVPVLPGDTVDTLQARALPMEHDVQIRMLQDFVWDELQELEPELLVYPDELHLLEQAKRTAIERYPRG